MKNPSTLPGALAVSLACSWALAGAAHAGTDTIVPASEWGQMTSVAGDTYGNNRLFFPFEVTPDQPLSISVTFTPSSYIPGRFDPGYISPGWFAVTRPCFPGCGFEGNVIFEMRKPYNTDFTASMTQILIGDGGRIEGKVADYVPGASYAATLTWNRAASTIDIDVAGQHRTVASYGEAISGLVFYGPSDTHMVSSFGQLSVMTQAVPEPGTWALLLAGLGAVALKAGRRHRTATAATKPRA
jgi:hypothetical protein